MVCIVREGSITIPLIDPPANLFTPPISLSLSLSLTHRYTTADASRHISIGNLDPTSSWGWAPVICAYATSLHVLYLLKYEYSKFLKLRVAYLTRGDPDVSPQKVMMVTQ